MLGWIKDSGKLITLARAAARAVEALKEDAPGAEKRKAAIDFVMAAWPFAEQGLHVDVDNGEVRELIGRLIDDVVAVENLLAIMQQQRMTAKLVAETGAPTK